MVGLGDCFVLMVGDGLFGVWVYLYFGGFYCDVDCLVVVADWFGLWLCGTCLGLLFLAGCLWFVLRVCWVF